MGFLDRLASTASDVAEKSRNEIGKNMKRYRHCSQEQLETITKSQSSSFYQKAAAYNLLAGEQLHLMDEF